MNEIKFGDSIVAHQIEKKWGNYEITFFSEEEPLFSIKIPASRLENFLKYAQRLNDETKESK